VKNASGGREKQFTAANPYPYRPLPDA